MTGLGALALLTTAVCGALAANTPAPAPYTGKIVRPVIKIFGANPVRTGVSTTDYWDDGADCSDHVPFDMDLNFHVAAGGDVVRLDKPGKYVIKYYCANDKGMQAVPKKRTVIVSKSYKPQCDEVTVKGTGFSGSGTWQGTYALTKDINNGKPVYKQQAGLGAKPHYLYSFISDKAEDQVHMWLINTFDPMNKFLDVIKSPAGLKVKSSASKPEGIHHPWRQWAGHSWETGKMTIHCTKGAAVNRDATDFTVDATVEVAGYTSKTFTVAAREKFTEATAIALDVATEDVHVLSVTDDTRAFRRRRLLESAAQAHQRGAIKIAFEVRTPEAEVATAVSKDLHKDAFDEALYSRMGEQGMQASRVLVDQKSISMAKPSSTGAILKVAALMLGVAAIATIAYRSGMRKGASHAVVADDATTDEERASLRV